MDEAKSRRRLIIWIGIGILLAGVTAAAGAINGAGTAWGLGAILATVFSGTFAFIEYNPARKNQSETALAKAESAAPETEQPGAKMPESNVHETAPKEPAHVQGDSISVARPPLTPWPTADGNAHLFWHPALNTMEDVLAAQITDPAMITNVAERAEINPASLSPGRGSPTNYWHEVLRRAWMNGGQGKVCDVLQHANAVAGSDAISGLVDDYCRSSQ
jgi:hypothetical protein